MDASFSFATRVANLEAMAETPVDVLVVGGGITGAGIARDAAMRGFRTALVEREDFGAGTSSRSSRLVHGGLRYLESHDFGLALLASRERRILLKIAPHLVWPRSFIFPIYAGARIPRWKLAAGLLLADVSALFWNVGRHRWLSKRALLRSEPALRERGLRGGARYFDAQCDDARLTLANVRAAHQYGALVANYAQVDKLHRAGGRVRGARVTDRVANITRSVHAHVVVNATGPWSDSFRDDGQRRLRLSKGTHVMVPRNRISHSEAVTFTSPIDGRIIFIVPWGDRSYIGTTDIEYSGSPDEALASAEEVVYLLRSANAVFPDARLQPDDVAATWAGLRPLLSADRKARPSSVCREHAMLEQEGALSVLGGNLTTYRSTASKAVDRVASILHDLDGRPVPPRAPTDQEHLPGGQVQDLGVLMAEAEREGANSQLAKHLVRTFGNEAPAVVRLAKADARLAEPVVPNHVAIRAELIHAIRREMAVTLGDLLIRRTHIFFEAKGKAVRQAADLVDLIGDEFEWDPQRKASELTAYLQEVDLNHQFRAKVPETR